MSAIPKFEINWVVDRFHVGAPDEDIAQDIRSRCSKQSPDFTLRCVAHALRRHDDNRSLYRRVMGGRR